MAVAQMATCRTPVNETKALVVRDWLSNKDILAWPTNKDEVEAARGLDYGGGIQCVVPEDDHGVRES